MGGEFGQIWQGLNRDLKTLNGTKMKNYFKNFGTIIKTAPQEAKYGYYCLFAGIFLILLQMIFWVF